MFWYGRVGSDARRARLRQGRPAAGVPAAVEISQSGHGAHVWVLFTDPVSAKIARAVGTVPAHKAIALRRSIDLRSYDRLVPNQDVLPDGGLGNLIAAPPGRSEPSTPWALTMTDAGLRNSALRRVTRRTG